MYMVYTVYPDDYYALVVTVCVCVDVVVEGANEDPLTVLNTNFVHYLMFT